MRKSVKINAILNVIKTISLVIFPLITFPYATRVLGANNIGKVQFGSSIVSYFLLLASLGLSMYAIREGTAYRNDRSKMSYFASQMFSINLLFTLVSYVILFLLLLLPTKLQSYKYLILMQSITVLFTTVGVEWIYSIFEDYLYITVRSIITQIISLVLLFVLVRTKSDYYQYALVSVIATSSSYLFNFIHARKYCDIRITFKTNLSSHIKPLLILFSNNVATQIYINSDVTMLGLMLNDYYVGIYGVATKIYFMVKSILNAMITVVVPRLSYYKNNDRLSEFNVLCSKIFNSCLIFILPAILGLFLLSDNIVSIIAGAQYIEAGITLKILSMALIFAVFANFFANAILIVNKLEKYVLKATVIAAVVNIVMNLAFIPLFKQNGVALTTLIAEMIVASLSFYYARKDVYITNIGKNIGSCILGLFGIVVVYFIINNLINNAFLLLILVVIISPFVYFGILLLCKNMIVVDALKQIKKKFSI